MTIELTPLNTTTDTFGDWIQRTNDIVDLLATRVVTAGITADTTQGDVNLQGALSVNIATARDLLRVSSIDAVSGNPSVNILSQFVFGSTNRTVQINSNSTGPRAQYRNNSINWDIGLNGSTGTGEGSEFVITLTGSTNPLYKFDRDGNFTSSASLNSPRLNATQIQSATDLAVSAQEVSLTSANTSFSGARTTLGSALTAITGPSLSVSSTATFSGNVSTANLTVNGTGTFSSNTIFNARATFNAVSTFAETATFIKPIVGSLNGNALTATNVAFSGITGRPTNLSGYGISDAISNSGEQPYNITIRNGQPIFNWQHTNGNRGQIRIDGSNWVFARQSGSNPLVLDLNNADATFGSWVYVNGEVHARSDARFKTNVKTLEGTLDKVLKSRGVSYTKDERESIGVIAQEMEKLFPEVVGTDNEGFKSVSYGSISAILIEAIKELNEKVERIAKNI